MAQSDPIQYDLAPLLWWEDPWLVARIGVLLFASAALILIGYRLYYRARRKKIRPTELWQPAIIERLERIAVTQFGPSDMSELVECLRIIAVFERYAIYRPAMTDSEFIALLLINNRIPEELHSVFLDIVTQANKVKFAQDAPDCEKNRSYIMLLIRHIAADMHS